VFDTDSSRLIDELAHLVCDQRAAISGRYRTTRSCGPARFFAAASASARGRKIASYDSGR